MVTVSSGPGITAPESATIKEVTNRVINRDMGFINQVTGGGGACRGVNKCLILAASILMSRHSLGSSQINSRINRTSRTMKNQG